MQSITSQSVPAVFVDPRNAEDNRDYSQRVEIRTNLRRADYHVFVSPLDCKWPLAVGDYFVDAGDTYQLVTLSPVKPGTEVVLFICQVVRG